MPEDTEKIVLDEHVHEKVVVIEKDQEKAPLLVGFNRVLEILAGKISRKAALIALAMVLIYLLAVTPTVSSLLVIVAVVSGLAIFGVMLQFVIDYMNANKREELKRLKKIKDISSR